MKIIIARGFLLGSSQARPFVAHIQARVGAQLRFYKAEMHAKWYRSGRTSSQHLFVRPCSNLGVLLYSWREHFHRNQLDKRYADVLRCSRGDGQRSG